MSLNVAKEVAALQTVDHQRITGQVRRSLRRTDRCPQQVWLVKRIAWRLQALAQGDLSQRDRQRAALWTWRPRATRDSSR